MYVEHLWVPADVVFVARFPSNSLFLSEIVARKELFRVVIGGVVLASSINREDDENVKIRKATDF